MWSMRRCRHSGTWRPIGDGVAGRASKKAVSYCSTAPAVLVISTLIFTEGFACQLMHTISPLSSRPTG
jgi:hypothetical protein